MEQGSFIPPLLFAYGVPHVGEGMASILGAKELPVAVLFSYFVLHETISPIRWAGVLIVLLAIALPENIRRFKQQHSYPKVCTHAG
ncbi:EamA family transporter [Paenibacillus radicis (ex Gao et al. 2016)]|uniref:EamA family transporter n=1 Tax=Paenibacillus radicis (ex Gao et al. 2016) TaxID=1737354 RepID=UPI00227A8332|nr:DMT family transporter [Paenibacillus radicis (ex Gao et al. 2016)]